MAKIAAIDLGLMTMQTANNQMVSNTNETNQSFANTFTQAKKDATSPKEFKKDFNTNDKNPVTLDSREKDNFIAEEKNALPDENVILDENENRPVEEVPEQEEVVLVESKPEDETEELSTNQLSKIDEEVLKQIQETLAEIMMKLEQMIGADTDEIKELFQDLGIEPMDFLTGDTKELVLQVTGEENISLVMNEDLLSEVNDVTSQIDNLLSKLENDTKLTTKDLQNILETFIEENKSQVSDEDTTINLDVKPINETDITIKDIRPEDNMEEDLPFKLEIENPDTKNNMTQVSEVKDKTEENTDESEVDINKVNIKTEENISEKPLDENTSNKKNETHEHKNNSDSNNLFNNEVNNKILESDKESVVTEFKGYTSDIDPTSILRQIADNVKILKQNDETTMEMQLHPQSLGTVRIALTTKGGSVTAQFTAQNESVKQALEAQVSQLRTNLEEQGVKIEAIEISVESHELEKNLDQNGQNKNEQQSKEQDEKVTKVRRRNINLRAWANGDVDENEEALSEDEKLTAEMMALYGNLMDLLA